MRVSDIHPKFGEAESNDLNEQRYDALLRLCMKKQTGRELILYILRDMYYFLDVKTEEARAVRAAALRLIERIEGATGLSLDVGFSSMGGKNLQH